MCKDYYNMKKLPQFSFLEEKNHIISIVGAGGKTSTMYCLADYYSKKGLKVLATTSTHIRKPKFLPYAKNIEEIENIWKSGRFALIGKETINDKLCMLEYTLLQEFMKNADIVLIEADGAKEMPLKVPKDNEPVIIDESDIVIGVVGLDCLNKPLKDVCFRIEQATNILNKTPNDLILIDDVYKILISENGTRKNVNNRDYYIILNKCDYQNLKEINQLAENLKKEIGKNNVQIIMKEG